MKKTANHEQAENHRDLVSQSGSENQIRDESQKASASREVPKDLKYLADNYQDVQDVRKRVTMREMAIRVSHEESPERMETGDHPYGPDLEKIERRYVSNMEKRLVGFPVYDAFILRVRGIGPRISAGLIGTIGEISRFGSVSSVWHYFGQHVVDGRAAHLNRGESAGYNVPMKALCWNIGESLIKANGWYKAWYDGEKPKEMAKHKAAPCGAKNCPEKLNVHNRTKRRMVKMFLSHFWEAWREIEGLPIRPPYVVEHFPEHAPGFLSCKVPVAPDTKSEP